MKDGKELKIDKDVSLNIQGENVGLTVINPRREKSGTYKVILRNAQGQDERDIQVNIMGMIYDRIGNFWKKGCHIASGYCQTFSVLPDPAA